MEFLDEQELQLVIAAIVEIIREDVDEDDLIIQQILDPQLELRRLLARRNEEREFSGIGNYVERIVTGYTDPYFKKHFRMSRAPFQV